MADRGTAVPRCCRLQFWFSSTGQLWLASVSLRPIDGPEYEYHPRIGTAGRTNLIPNSSFECGTVGWGSYNPEMQTWAGNLFRLIGELDETTAFQGTRSLRVDVIDMMGNAVMGVQNG
jgi:hypothetical protein